MRMKKISYAGYRFRPEIIHAVVAIDESGHHASVRRSPLSANASVQLDPIRMPAPSTSAPPIITFAAAESGGTSM